MKYKKDEEVYLVFLPGWGGVGGSALSAKFQSLPATTQGAAFRAELEAFAKGLAPSVSKSAE